MKKNTDMDNKRLLLKAGRKVIKPLKHTEFSCPVCGGVATAAMVNETIRVECHACSRWAQERY